MWGQSTQISQRRPGAPSPEPTAVPFRSAVTHTGAAAPQSNETRLRRAASVSTLPTRTATQLRHTYVNLGLIVCPLISGLFFGLIATVLRLRSGDFVHALEVGALAGFVILTANVLALCLVMSKPMDERPVRHAPPSTAHDAAGQRAS